MLEVIDPSPISALARKIAGRISHGGARKRMEILIFRALKQDVRCLRALDAEELEQAPDWARAKAEAGVTVYEFAPARAVVRKLQGLARGIEAAFQELIQLDGAAAASLDEDALRHRELLHAFFDKIGKASQETLEQKSRAFTAARAARAELARANERLCPDEEIFSAPGRTWRRLTTEGQLRQAGRALHNCMARKNTHSLKYVEELRGGHAHFFVLYDHKGAALMAVRALPNEMRIAEAKGPFNAKIISDDPDLTILAQARGWRTPPPLPSLAALSRPASPAVINDLLHRWLILRD